MKIFNVRYGYATNSSSTHSMVFRDKKIRDDESPFNYGWDFFTLASKEARARYWFTAVAQSVYRLGIAWDYAVQIAKYLCGGGIDVNVLKPGCVPSLDHQSCIAIPLASGIHFKWELPELHKEFIADLGKYLLQDRLVVLGGNDNEDMGHPLSYLPSSQVDIPTDWPDRVWGRKDPQGYWVLFNPRTGEKVRFSFEEQMERPQYSDLPELCDLKITDYCEKDCPFCYAGSGRDGRHGDYDSIGSIISRLAECGVFEVAIGGGEPTKHPDLPAILKLCNELGILPNLATGRIDWLETGLCKDIFQYCKAVGISVQSPTDIERANIAIERVMEARYKEDTASPIPHFYLHIVLGTITQEDFRAMLDKAYRYRMPIVLLGYKHMGRGAQYRAVPYEWWMDEILAARERGVYVTIGVDTTLARADEEKLNAAGVEREYYEIDEGAFSLFVDAVDCKMGPCSYMPNKMEPFKSQQLGGMIKKRFPYTKGECDGV